MTDEPKPTTWETTQLETLYNAVLNRMVITYCLNELVKSGVRTPMKDGVVARLRRQQQQENLIITNTVRRIDRGIQE